MPSPSLGDSSVSTREGACWARPEAPCVSSQTEPPFCPQSLRSCSSATPCGTTSCPSSGYGLKITKVGPPGHVGAQAQELWAWWAGRWEGRWRRGLVLKEFQDRVRGHWVFMVRSPAAAPCGPWEVALQVYRSSCPGRLPCLTGIWVSPLAACLRISAGPLAALPRVLSLSRRPAGLPAGLTLCLLPSWGFRLHGKLLGFKYSGDMSHFMIPGPVS